MDEIDERHDLSWITYNQLCTIAEKRFRKLLTQLAKPSVKAINDPTLVIALASFLDRDVEVALQMLKDYSIIKTLQNNIGNFHQDVLGTAEGWRDLGTAGGVYDIESESPVELAGNRYVIAEVKMRYNTIKKSEEPALFRRLKDAVSSRGGHKKCVGYLIQIVPEHPIPYDTLWKVSGSEVNESVRVIDGRSAYHLVTGDPNAIDDLFKLLPLVFDDIARKVNPARPELGTVFTATSVEEALARTLPIKSALMGGE